MSDEQINALFRKHDALQKAVGELDSARQLHAHRLDEHENDLGRMAKEFGEKLDKIMKGQDNLESDRDERKGAQKAYTYQIWLAFSVIGLLFTALSLYRG